MALDQTMNFAKERWLLQTRINRSENIVLAAARRVFTFAYN